MGKYIHLIFILLIPVFTACSYKMTQTTVTKGEMTAFTKGDYEIGQVAKELSKNLAIPLYQESFDQNHSTSLDEVTLIKVDNALCLILNGKIFQENGAEPIENAVYIVQEITDILKKYPHIIIQVTGHTDKNEKSKDHQDLSDNRAITIAEILYKLEAKHETYAKGCADKKPLFHNQDTDQELSNARVEIYLYSDKDKMLDHCQ